MKDIKIFTDRLQLSIIQESDLYSVHELLSIPAVDQYNTLGIPFNKKITLGYIKKWISDFEIGQEFVFKIINVSNQNVVGLISLRIGTPIYKIGEIWYKLFPHLWGKGFATEATAAILKFGFERHNLHRVEAGCAILNIGSARVLEKVGIRREGQKRKVLPLKTGWSDAYQYGILEEDWYNTSIKN